MVGRFGANKVKAVFVGAFAGILLTGAVFGGEARPWAHEGSDLDADPAVRFGVLDNGLRFAVMPNSEPPKRVSLRLLVEVGSLMEEDAERGMAHYLEHMGFKGTTHFSPGEMIELGQRLGMAFGPDTNAHTSFHETVYKFEVPEAEDALIRPAFLALRDYADGMLILEEEAESERGVILAEKRDRDSASFRSIQDVYDFAFPYSPFRLRFPIGTEEAIRTMDHGDMRRFYERWYTVDRFAVVVVGDIDPDDAVSLIEEFFGDAEPNPDPLQEPSRGSILPQGEAYRFYHDPELGSTQVNVFTVWEQDDAGDTRGTREAGILRDLATAILNRRFEMIARSEDAPFASAGAYAYSFLDFAEFAGLQATTRPETWEKALERIVLEKRRALEHGFLESELAVARANVLNSYERAAAQAESRESRALADALVRAVSLDRVFTSPEQNLELARRVLDEATPETVHAALVDLWAQTGDRLVRMESEEEIDEAYKRMRTVFRASHGKEVEPPEDFIADDFAYAVIGEPSAIVERRELEDLDAEQVVFANNVVLNLKRTDFERNRVRVGARFGKGRLGLAPEQEGLDFFASYIFVPGALEAHSADELETLFAGKTVGIDFSVGDDAFVLSGTTTPRDLEDQLALMAAHILAPGFRPEAERRFRQVIPQIYQQVNHTVDGVMRSRVERFLVNDDFRFGIPPRDQLERHSTEAVSEWMAGALASSALEIAVVGDFEPDEVVEAVQRTFGALSPREAEKIVPDGARKVDLLRGPAEETFTYRTSIPQARGVMYWVTDDTDDVRKARRLAVLSGVVNERIRVRIRNELGEAYSPFAYHDASRVFDGMGHIIAIVNVDAGRLDLVGEILHDIATSIVEDGIDEDEFERVLNPRIRSLENQARSNPYWLGTVLLGAREHPRQLDWARTLFTDYPAITRGEVEALAREYLTDDRIFVRIVPEPMDDGEAGREEE